MAADHQHVVRERSDGIVRAGELFLSKAGIIALTKVSAREFARQNVTVNAIAPGFIDVGMSKGMPEEVTQNFIKQIPLGRLGDVMRL